MNTTTEKKPVAKRRRAAVTPFTISFELTPVPGKTLPSDFRKQVALLRRPYIPISREMYDHVMEMTENPVTDIVLLGDVQHAFGPADGGYALMPLKEPI